MIFLHIHQETRYHFAMSPPSIERYVLLYRQSRMILADLGQGSSWLQNIKGALFLRELHQFMLCQHVMCLQILQTPILVLHLLGSSTLSLRKTILVGGGFEQIILVIYHLGCLIMHNIYLKR